jgi:hypothetical protein
MTDRPAPMVPAEVDLRDFAFMPLDVQRLRDSDLASDETPEACWAAVLLWCASWHQVPAASIPDNDQWQAKHCGYVAQGKVSAGWKRIRNGALRGWVPCSDGRLYHPVVAEKAMESWRHKLAQRWRSEAARIKKHNQRHGTSVEMPDLDAWIASGCPQGQAHVVPRDSAQASPGHDGNVPWETPSKRPDRTGTGPDRTGQGPDTLPVVVGAEPPAPPPAAAAAATPADKPDRGARLAKDWQLPKAWGEWALAKYPQWTADKVRDEALKFRNHWTALTGKSATKLDWLATWQNWCMSDIAHRDDPKANGRAAGAQPDLDELTAGVQRRLGITPANPEAIDA